MIDVPLFFEPAGDRARHWDSVGLGRLVVGLFLDQLVNVANGQRDRPAGREYPAGKYHSA